MTDLHHPGQPEHYDYKLQKKLCDFSKSLYNARDGIRTQELLRDQALNLAPLTWLGYPRACIDYD